MDTGKQSISAVLRAIVSVRYEDRISCQQPGCGHSVYRRVHVVHEAGKTILLGSTCFSKRYGDPDALGAPQHGGGGGDGIELTEEQRQILVENTEALLSHYDQLREQKLLEAQAQALAQLERVAQLKAQHFLRHPKPTTAQTPWPWVKQHSSMLYVQMRDGAGWVRAQHQDGRQILMPWPSFDGWDESLPSFVGTVHPFIEGFLIGNLPATISYLREHATWEKMSGHWAEIAAEIARHKL